MECGIWICWRYHSDIDVSESVAGVDMVKNIKIDEIEVLMLELEAKDEKSKLHSDLLLGIVDDLDVAIWGKNIQGHFMFLNKACAENILHTTVAEALNLSDADFENDALAPICMKSDQFVIESMKTHRFLEHAEYPVGQVWLDSTKSPWIRDGFLIGTVGSAKVITDVVPEYIKEKYAEDGCKCIPVDVLLSVDNFAELMKASDAEVL